jgi:IS5 family transposase
LYNLSDDQLEFLIVDRMSFKRFLGLKKSDKVPDSKTFLAFREQLIEKDVIEAMFKTFNEIGFAKLTRLLSGSVPRLLMRERSKSYKASQVVAGSFIINPDSAKKY